MKILVSNDDGYLATGINVLTEALAEIADVVVVAPDRPAFSITNLTWSSRGSIMARISVTT
jgi:5'/3'-nucleotidase SurE